MESNVDPLINAGIFLKRTASENVNVIFLALTQTSLRRW